MGRFLIATCFGVVTPALGVLPETTLENAKQHTQQIRENDGSNMLSTSNDGPKNVVLMDDSTNPRPLHRRVLGEQESPGKMALVDETTSSSNATSLLRVEKSLVSSAPHPPATTTSQLSSGSGSGSSSATTLCPITPSTTILSHSYGKCSGGPFDPPALYPNWESQAKTNAFDVRIVHLTDTSNYTVQ